MDREDRRTADTGVLTWKGTLARGPYAALGAFLFIVKFGVDRFVSRAMFDRDWTLFNYVHVPSIESLLTATETDTIYLLILAGISLPFVWIGTTLTVKRLRSAELPAWLVLLFFAPFVNLIFFLVLCVIPTRQRSSNALRPLSERITAFFDNLIPPSKLGSAFGSIVLTLPAFLVGIVVSIQVFASYGYSIFVGMPFALGMIAAMLYGYHRERSRIECVTVSCVASVMLAGLLLIFAVEGAVCIVMAAPLFIALSSLGGLVGYVIQKRPTPKQDQLMVAAATLLVLPVLFCVELLHEGDTPLTPVRTTVKIDAPREVVWEHVVSFSELGPPEDWLFRIGISYPMKARIEGAGVGAVRYCDFSTGSFVEPITVWDEPNLLAFSVKSQPHPMQEWTFFKDLDPAHLDGFFGSEKGQFMMVEMADGTTLLEGTTWYRHRIWPSIYWRIWSDWILHKIHRRVLTHVKALAEDS